MSEDWKHDPRLDTVEGVIEILRHNIRVVSYADDTLFSLAVKEAIKRLESSNNE